MNKALSAMLLVLFLAACSNTGTCLDRCWLTFSGRCSACMEGKHNFSAQASAYSLCKDDECRKAVLADF